MAKKSPRTTQRPTLPAETLAALAADLRDIRTTLGLPATEIAARAGLTKAAINQYEQGQACPSLAALVELARAYGVPVARLTASLDRPANAAGKSFGKSDSTA
jgi:transcriptional regulator with XRE-family HTH domain